MKELTKALIKFQGLLENPKKEATNPHFRSNYVDLDGLLKAIKSPLKESDLFFTQQFMTNENGNFLLTTLMHVSGEKIESSISINPDKANIQGFGSAVTYLRRYSLEAICGICGTNDDDGNQAVDTGYQTQTQRSDGMRKNVGPSDKQKKFYFQLLNKLHEGSVPAKDIEDAKKMDIKAMSEAINELKLDLGV